MISAEGLSFRLSSSRLVLRDVSLCVPNGLVTAVLGSNGTGKTTLIKCLCGILTLSGGRVVIDDLELPGANVRDVSRRVALVTQANRVPSLTVFEAVLMGRLPFSGSHPSVEDEERAAEVIARFGLTSVADKPCSFLSGGELQKAFLACACLQDVPNLVLDEPLNALDFRSRHEIMRMLVSFAHHYGRSVMVVLHDVDMALRYCDRFIVLKDGRIHSKDSLLEMDAATVSDIYGIRCEILNCKGYAAVVPVE